MSFRRLLAWTTVLSLVIGSGVGHAGVAPATTCRFSAVFRITPGLSMVANSGSFTSGGSTGWVLCDGSVMGHDPLGRGAFGAAGRYGTAGSDTCLSGEGTALQSFRLATYGGAFDFENPVAFAWRVVSTSRTRQDGSVPGIIAGEFHGRAASGTFKVQALEGDCVTRPVTRVRFDAEATFAP